jgi:hypothetical protein
VLQEVEASRVSKKSAHEGGATELNLETTAPGIQDLFTPVIDRSEHACEIFSQCTFL